MRPLWPFPLSQPPTRSPPEDLRGAFQAFASFGAREAAPRDMDGKALIKVVRDTGLLGGGLTATDVDLTFAKVKGGRASVSQPVEGGRSLLFSSSFCRAGLPEVTPRFGFAAAAERAQVKSKGARRITFDQFLSALSNFADKKVRCRRGRAWSQSARAPQEKRGPAGRLGTAAAPGSTADGFWTLTCGRRPP